MNKKLGFELGLQFAKSISRLAIMIYGSEEEKIELRKQLDLDAKRLELASENIQKGYLPFFDKNSKPISEELGCPHCGEYCYAHYNSHCEVEMCEFENNTTVFCPKIKCKHEYYCQSTLTPIGLRLDENSRWGYKKGDSLSMFYKNKTYNFTVLSDYLTTGFLTELIRKFFDYDLTRKEMNEYILLESVNETNQN